MLNARAPQWPPRVATTESPKSKKRGETKSRAKKAQVRRRAARLVGKISGVGRRRGGGHGLLPAVNTSSRTRRRGSRPAQNGRFHCKYRRRQRDGPKACLDWEARRMRHPASPLSAFLSTATSHAHCAQRPGQGNAPSRRPGARSELDRGLIRDDRCSERTGGWRRYGMSLSPSLHLARGPCGRRSALAARRGRGYWRRWLETPCSSVGAGVLWSMPRAFSSPASGQAADRCPEVASPRICTPQHAMLDAAAS